MVQRDRQDDAIGVIRRLFKGERVTKKTDWYTLQDAALQLLPLQEDMPFAVASQVSPSGMTLAGKYGIGIISLGSMSEQGLLSLPTQWGFAETAAKKHGTTVDRKNWRVLLSWHVAETREKAREEAKHGLLRWHNEYITGTLQRPGRRAVRLARRRSRQDRVHGRRGVDHRHARRLGEDDQVGLRQERRLRHRDRLRARLGQSREHHAQLGHGGALCHPRDQRLRDQAARIAEIPDRKPRRVRARRPGHHGQDHGEKDAAEALKVTESPRFAAASASVPKMPGKQAAE